MQSLFLNPKFQASSHHLCAAEQPVCILPDRKPLRQVFSRRGSYSHEEKKTYIKLCTASFKTLCGPHREKTCLRGFRHRLEISDLESRGIAETKALISCAVQLICTFVSAYAKSMFSHDASHIVPELLTW